MKPIRLLALSTVLALLLGFGAAGATHAQSAVDAGLAAAGELTREGAAAGEAAPAPDGGSPSVEVEPGASGSDDLDSVLIAPVRAWTADASGHPKTQFVAGERIRLYFQARNLSHSWLNARLVMAVGETRYCVTTPCPPGNLKVLFNGIVRFPPGDSTWHLPSSILPNSPGGHRTYVADIAGSSASAEFVIQPGGGDPSAVTLFSAPNFSERAIAVDPGVTRLPNDFVPRSLRFESGPTPNWRLDVYGTVCSIGGRWCWLQYLASYRSDQPNLMLQAQPPYYVNLRR